MVASRVGGCSTSLCQSVGRYPPPHGILKAGEWFRRGRLLIVSPDSLGTACPLSGRNSLIVLFRFLRPALSATLDRAVRNGVGLGDASDRRWQTSEIE